MARSTIGLFNNLRTRQTIQIGEGTDVQRVENTAIVDYQGFGRGLNVSVPPSRLPEGFTPEIQNYAINERDELVKVPGIVTEESFGARVPKSMFVHGNPGTGLAELVLIDGAFMGVRASDGAITVWDNLGLPAGPIDWASCIHGDLLILTNGGGSAAFSRQPNATAVNVLPWGPARTVMSFAGRVFAGGVTDSGTYVPMGISWTGASSEADDIGLGSGFEELLDDTANGDQIVAMRSINFNTAVILTRNAVWTARITGNPNRPADFEPVVSGFGAISNDTVVRVPSGVAYISTRDIVVFDGNTPQSISLPVNHSIFPIDTDRITDYALNYVESRNTLQVLTPNEVYEYSFVFNRWLKSTIQARRVVNTGTEFASVESGMMIGATPVGGWGNDWGFSWGTSSSNGGGEIGVARPLDTTIYLRSNQIGREAGSTDRFFGLPFISLLETNLQQAQSIDNIVSIKRIIIEYRGPGATLQFSVPDGNGDFRVVRTVELPQTSRTRTLSFKVNNAGKQAGIQVAQLGGSVLIGRLQAEVELRSLDRQGGVR